MPQVNGQAPLVFVGCDPGSKTQYGCALDLREDELRLKAGPIVYSTQNGKVYGLRIGSWEVPEGVPGVFTLEFPKFRGAGENRQAGAAVQATIAKASQLAMAVELYGLYCLKADPQTILRNMTTYHRDKGKWDADQRRLHRNKADRQKYPHTKMVHVCAMLKQFGIATGRGTILNSSHLQESAEIMLFGMRHFNEDTQLRTRRRSIVNG